MRHPRTFLGEDSTAPFGGTPIVEGNYVLSMEVAVWATVFGFQLATPFSFDGFPFPILGDTVDNIEEWSTAIEAYPNPVRDRLTVKGVTGAVASLRSLDGRAALRSLTSEWLSWTSPVPNGIYFPTLVGEGVDEVQRLVVQH